MLSEKIRGLLSTWMAGYARGLVNECADEAAKLERVARAVDAFADDRWNFDIVSDSATPATWLAVIDALKEAEHLFR